MTQNKQITERRYFVLIQTTRQGRRKSMIAEGHSCTTMDMVWSAHKFFFLPDASVKMIDMFGHEKTFIREKEK